MRGALPSVLNLEVSKGPLSRRILYAVLAAEVTLLVLLLEGQWTDRTRARQHGCGMLPAPRHRMKIAGLAAGGTASIGTVGYPESVTIRTSPGESPEEVMWRLVDLMRYTSPFQTSVSYEGDSIRLSGRPGFYFFRTTDKGLQTVGAVKNLTAAASKAGRRVRLSWDPPDHAPEKIFVFRHRTRLKVLPGTAKSYDDESFSGAWGSAGGFMFHYHIVCGGASEDGGCVMFSDVARVETNNPEVMLDDTFRVLTTGDGRGMWGATAGRPYKLRLHKNGGTDPVSWSLAEGKLPGGLALGGAGIISGVPEETGKWDFIAKVTDAAGATAAGALSIAVAEAREDEPSDVRRGWIRVY